MLVTCCNNAVYLIKVKADVMGSREEAHKRLLGWDQGLNVYQ